jgi:hypothetical protein
MKDRFTWQPDDVEITLGPAPSDIDDEMRTMANTQPQPRHTDGTYRPMVLPKPLRAPIAPPKGK